MNDILEKWMLLKRDHWICTAQSDNGIDDHKITESLHKLESERLVYDSGKIIGYTVFDKAILFSQYETSKVKGPESTDWVPGWGDIKEYSEFMLVKIKQ